MRLSDLIQPEDIILDLNVKDKSQALKHIAEELCAERLLDPHRVEEAMASRERLGSTGIGRGIALPHVCLSELETSRGLFVRLDHPIDFQAIDGAPVDLIFATISPIEHRNCKGEQLSILAKIARFLNDPQNAHDLRSAKSAKAVRAILDRQCTPSMQLAG